MRNGCISPEGDNGSFVGSREVIYTPCPVITILVASQPRTRVAMGPEAATASVCLVVMKETVAFPLLRPGPSGFTKKGNDASGFTIVGSDAPQGEAAYGRSLGSA